MFEFTKLLEGNDQKVAGATSWVKHLDGISDADIVGLNIPNGLPLVYELDADLKPIRHYYLGDEKVIT